MSRRVGNDRKSVRIRDEKVNKWIEQLPFGMFSDLVNNFLEEQYKIDRKEFKEISKKDSPYSNRYNIFD